MPQILPKTEEGETMNRGDDAATKTKDYATAETASASEKLHEAQDAVRDGLKDATGKATDAARQAAEQHKSAAAASMSDFAMAIRAASDELGKQDQGLAARVVREAADGLGKMSSAVSGSSVDEMIRSVTRFGRDNPAAFLTGAVLAGVALGRFAKASSERDHPAQASGAAGTGYPAPPQPQPQPGAQASGAAAPRQPDGAAAFGASQTPASAGTAPGSAGGPGGTAGTAGRELR